MCLYGNYRKVSIINPNQGKKQVAVDACIAEEIQELNDKGVITVGSCCSHGLAGNISEYDNGFGKWKGINSPPHALISEVSKSLCESLGYKPIPHYYADGEYGGVMTIYLNSGCVTIGDCKDWHKENHIIYEKNLGFI